MKDSNSIYCFLEKNIEDSKLKYELKRWIKKLLIIKILYNGKCVACEESINLNNNMVLAGYSFHHIDPILKSFSGNIWIKIQKNKITEIIDILIQQKCIGLCSNCHNMLEATRFIKNIDLILDSNTSHIVKKNMNLYKKNISAFLENIKQVNNFSHFNNI